MHYIVSRLKFYTKVENRVNSTNCVNMMGLCPAIKRNEPLRFSLAGSGRLQPLPPPHRAGTTSPRWSSRCSGTTSACLRPALFKRTWLPRWRTTSQPSLQSALMRRSPETTGWRGLTPAAESCGE